MKIMLLSILGAVLLHVTGCANLHTPSVISSTGTVIGVEISENPATQMPRAKLGYNRGEFAWVPISPGGVTPNVLHELSYSSIFDLKGSAIYQRMAVGDIAVSQPGAALMFAKDKTGAVDPVAAAAITKAVTGIPAPAPSATASKLSLGKQYHASNRKEAFDAVAKSFGYADFSTFLIEPVTPDAQVVEIKARLIDDGLFVP